jgi:hypothetical protein
MKALTLYQPYASLIACGVKTIETRSWSTPYRGLLAIHAAKTVPWEWEEEGAGLCERFKEQLGGRVLGDRHSLFGGNVLPMSAIVAVADFTACLPTTDDDEEYLCQLESGKFQNHRIFISEENRLTGNFSSDRFGWCLSNIRALKNPVPARGNRGIWDVDAALQALINKELP